MEYQDFSKLLRENMELINLELTDRQVTQFYDYMNLLIQWNKKINLTAITEENDIILKHFIDCMTILNYFDQSKTVIDVGSGAGFPGIPIAIMRDDLKITLLDSLNKRVQFLNCVIDNLKLVNVETVHERAEDYGKIKREQFDYATSRAVANLSTLVEYLLPFVKIGGKCICMKGFEIEEEIENSKFAISQLGGKIKQIDQIQLPNSDIIRKIVVIEKVKNTPKNYPRKSGLASKQPLNNI